MPAFLGSVQTVAHDERSFIAWGNCYVCGRIPFVVNRERLRESLQRSQSIALCCPRCGTHRRATASEADCLRRINVRPVSPHDSWRVSLPETHA